MSSTTPLHNSQVENNEISTTNINNNNNNNPNSELVSSQEQDQLHRSNKKIKRKITHIIFGEDSEQHETPMEEDDPSNAIMKEQTQAMRSNAPTSFKEMLTNNHLSMNEKQREQSFNPFGYTNNDDDLASDDDEPPEVDTEDANCPVILLTKEEKQRMRQPWKLSLIIKMFDKHIGYMTLLRRLTKKWQIKGQMNLIDIGYSYYIAKFTAKEDYDHVLTGGPWLIDDHYLTVRKWVPNFTPDDEPIKILNAWVRIPDLAVEYFDAAFLHKVGSKIGKVIKIDNTTANAERGKFTRMCVEIDLSKPLLSKFWLKGKIWKIQYEGLRLICYHCGKINHKEEDCPDKQENRDRLAKEAEAKQKNVVVNPVEETNFGDWMLVKKPVRNRGSSKQINNGEPSNSKKAQENPNPVQDNPKQYPKVNNAINAKNKNQATGSRFEILNNNGADMLQVDSLAGIREKDSNLSKNAIIVEDSAEFQEANEGNFETADLAESTPQGIQNLNFAIGKFKERFPKKKDSGIISIDANNEKSQQVNHNKENPGANSKAKLKNNLSTKKGNNTGNKTIQHSKASTQASIKPSPLQPSQVNNILPTQKSHHQTPNELGTDKPIYDTSHLSHEFASRMDIFCRQTNGDASHGDHASNDPPDGSGFANLDGAITRTARANCDNDTPLEGEVCFKTAN